MKVRLKRESIGSIIRHKRKSIARYASKRVRLPRGEEKAAVVDCNRARFKNSSLQIDGSFIVPLLIYVCIYPAERKNLFTMSARRGV